VDGIVEAVSAKLSGTLVIKPREITGVPRDEVGRQLLLFERPPGWEYLYLAAQLLHERDLVESMYRDHKLRYAPSTGTVIAREQVYGFMSVALNDVLRLTSILEQLMTPEVQTSAVGLPGKSGDAEAIAHLAARWNSIYVDLMQWAARLRGASTPNECHPAMNALAAYVDSPIESYRAFIDQFAVQLQGLPQRLAGGETIEFETTLTFAIPPEVSAALHAEMEKLALG
jgi:hypothetical protein